jgi:hypothetical protein
MIPSSCLEQQEGRLREARTSHAREGACTMSIPPISEDLLAIIARLRPELQTLLGSDYAPFAAQLDVFLAGGSENQVLELFRKYPVAFERLQGALAQQEEETWTTKGGLGLFGYPGIYGDPKKSIPSIRYRCKVGPHIVAAEEFEERDAAGNALCPEHHTPMVLERESEPG